MVKEWKVQCISLFHMVALAVFNDEEIIFVTHQSCWYMFKYFTAYFCDAVVQMFGNNNNNGGDEDGSAGRKRPVGAAGAGSSPPAGTKGSNGDELKITVDN